VELLQKLKEEKLRIDHWRDKESTRDTVFLEIKNFLYDDKTGLPESYTIEDIDLKSAAVFEHVYRAYPSVPSPYYAAPN
jgi:type I restriction enzyme, R subunit